MLEVGADENAISEFVTSELGNDVKIRKHGQELDYTIPLDNLSKFAGTNIRKCFL